MRTAPGDGPRPLPLRVRLTGGALAEQLSAVRAQVIRWARGMQLTEMLVEDLVLATHEALANVADHAYPDGHGEAWLEVHRDADSVRATVRDRGRWRPRAVDPGWRGRGLRIIRGLADHVEVQHDSRGTTVRMRWKLPR